MFIDTADVVEALRRNEVVPFFQPLVWLNTGQLSGFEVLARWDSPNRGISLPTNFISLAEENGLIGQLTEQVFRKAFAAAKAVSEPLLLALNLSAIQMHSATLVSEIREYAETAGFPLDRLTIEITESALLSNLGRARTVVRGLKDLGCRLALDDFGTGYSSLAHLGALPFDELKIDRSFIQNMTGSREGRKIVAAVVGLGDSLGLTTVGEGVETQEQANMLLWLGCELGQGWLYGRPVKASMLETMVAAPPRKVLTDFSIQSNGRSASSLEALAHLSAIYEGAPMGLCFLDQSHRYVSLNERHAAMNGFSVKMHLGRTIEEMMPDLRPEIESYLCRALAGEAMTGIEISEPPTIAGGSHGTTLLSCQPARDEANEVIGVSLAMVDITSSKVTEQALRESERNCRKLAAMNLNAPWTLDAKGNDVRVSAVSCEEAARTAERIQPGWLQALHPADADLAVEATKAGILTGEAIDVEYRTRGTGAEWRWKRSRGFPSFDSSGHILCWHGVVEDIDERKQLEAALVASQAHVETLLHGNVRR